MSDNKWFKLTDIELEVLKLIHEGLSKTLIGVRLGKAMPTINNYIVKIYKKINVSSFVKAALYYERNIL